MKTQMYKGKFENVFIPGLLFYHRPDKGSQCHGAYFRYRCRDEDYYYRGQKFKMTSDDKKFFSDIRNGCSNRMKEHISRMKSSGFPDEVVKKTKEYWLAGYRIRELREFIFRNLKIADGDFIVSLVRAFGFAPEKKGA